MNALYISAKRVDISPLHPLRLAGFANRIGVYEKVITPIEAQCLLVKQDGREVLIVGADLLWWSPDFVHSFRPRLAEAMNLSEEQILFTASHNHAGPGTGDTFMPLLETASGQYVAYLKEALLDACKNLRKHYEEASLTLNKVQIPCSINRRKLANGKILMEPNPEQAITQEAKILTLSRKKGMETTTPQDVLVHILHYPCHATSSAENALHSEYPGIIRKALEMHYPDSITVFLQGATADIRPNISENGHFVKKGYSETERFGQTVAAFILDALKEKGREVEPNLQLKHSQIALPLKPKYDKNILRQTRTEETIDLVWAKKVSEQQAYDYRLLNLSYLELSPDWKGLFFNAELVDAYQRYAQHLDINAMVIGYTNGMIGYLCTAQQLEEGGYEADESTYWFALSGPYDACLEEKINTLIREQLETD